MRLRSRPTGDLSVSPEPHRGPDTCSCSSRVSKECLSLIVPFIKDALLVTTYEKLSSWKNVT